MLPIEDLTEFLTEDGRINYGSLMRFWRKEVMGWKNARILANAYNEVLEYACDMGLMNVPEEITSRWIERMEKNNGVPPDKVRRWLLTTLLNIPPAYLGLTALQALPSFSEERKLPIPTTTSIDIDEYKKRLPDIWASPYDVLDEVRIKIYSLQEVSLYGSEQQRSQALYLLCEYLIAAGNVQRAQGYIGSAIADLNNALKLAQEKKYRDLEAKILYLRSYSLSERWSGKLDKFQNREDLFQSIEDSQLALERLDRKDENKPLLAAILEIKGNNLANQTQDIEDKLNALANNDEANKIVSVSGFRQDPLFLKIDEVWTHLGKAQACIAMGWPHSALEELAGLRKGNPRKMRRYLTALIEEAEAYAEIGKIEVGVTYAEDALTITKDVTSRTHLVRIHNLYTSLTKNDKYKRSPDVARLGAKLLVAQHPELFE